MKTTDIRQKLHHYIETAKDKKVKALYTMVEDEIEVTHDYWNDEEFVAELKRRQKAYLTGQTRTHTLPDATAEIKQAIKNVNRKR
jgi:hypothetical protein